MRICYIHQYFVTPDLPGSTRTYEFATRMVAAGHEVHVITGSVHPDAAQSTKDVDVEGIRVSYLGVPYQNTMTYPRRIMSFGRFAAEAVARARRGTYDLVYATSTPLTVAIPGVSAARSSRAPFVLEVRDLWPELPIALGALPNPALRVSARRLESWAYRNAQLVVALSPGMAAGVRRTAGPHKAIITVPNSCDIGVFDPSLDPAPFLSAHPELLGKRLIIYPGAVAFANDVSYLVRLASRPELPPDLAFVILGDGKDMPRVRALAEELGVLGTRVFIYDKVPKAQMGHVLAAAEIVVSTVVDIPEMNNNSANKFFDALAAGRCVAINHAGWQADLLQRTGAGITLPRSLQAAAVKLAGLLATPGATRAAGVRARAVAEQEFDRDLHAARLIGALEHVQAGRASSPS